MNKPPPHIDVDSPQFDENPEWTDHDFARALPASEVHPPHVVQALVRGRQKGPVKQQVTLRLDGDVLAKFRITGRGWQTRINEALRAAKL